MTLTELLLQEYFGKELYKKINKYYVSKIIILLNKNPFKSLMITQNGDKKEFYVDWIKFYELYKDIDNNSVDYTFKKYYFPFCDVAKFESAKDLYKYIVDMIEKADIK